jgi:hypothetical protein
MTPSSFDNEIRVAIFSGLKNAAGEYVLFFFSAFALQFIINFRTYPEVWFYPLRSNWRLNPCVIELAILQKRD